jgi:hypothetical protein
VFKLNIHSKREMTDAITKQFSGSLKNVNRVKMAEDYIQ